MKLVVDNGRALTMRQWAFEHNVSYASLQYRVNKMGLTPQEAIEMPIEKHKPFQRSERHKVEPFKLEANKLDYNACVSLVCEICQYAICDYKEYYKRGETTNMRPIERFFENFPYAIDLDASVILPELRRICRDNKRVQRDYRRTKEI